MGVGVFFEGCEVVDVDVCGVCGVWCSGSGWFGGVAVGFAGGFLGWLVCLEGFDVWFEGGVVAAFGSVDCLLGFFG